MCYNIENLTDYGLKLIYDLKQTLESTLNTVRANHMIP
uniref:Uncharacterized protein n=1 Tax=Siphoviridae sp. ctedO8 TaxID=2827907 RepID=A0A8S5T3U3_9CAUD|nr:MAG TPA: hypothetical protein [Siphoviridae sp. ctedO8]